MHKQLLLLCAVLVLTTASPHYYRQHYQYEQQSESYKNNELQHKQEEAGRYAKIEDGISAPKERSSFRQTEFHAPGADDDGSQASLSLTGHGGTGDAQRYQQQSSFRREWSQKNSGTTGSQGVGVVGTGNSDLHHSGHGYGHHSTTGGFGTGTASQSLSSSTNSESQRGIYGAGHHGQMHHTGHGYGHRRHHSQSLAGDSTAGQISGTGSQTLTSESQTNSRYGAQLQTSAGSVSYPGSNLRVVPGVPLILPQEHLESSSPLPTSYRREWSHHPGRGHGQGVGRGYHHNHGNVNLQTVDSTRSETITQQKEETHRGYGSTDQTQSQDQLGVGQNLEGTQRVVIVKDFGDDHHGRGHGHRRGHGHHEHGRGHGYGHRRHNQDEYTQRQYTGFDDTDLVPDTDKQTAQVSDTGTTFHSTGTNTGAQNSGTVFYSQTLGTNTASQRKLIGSGVDSNTQHSGTGTGSYVQSSSIGTNRQSPDIDDTSKVFGTGTGSQPGVVVPSSQSVGTGTVTHQTSRTYTISQSKLSGTTVPQTSDTTPQINFGGSGRAHLVSQPEIPANQGNIRTVPILTTPTNNKPVYAFGVPLAPEPEAPSSNDDRPKNIFVEVNRIAQEDVSNVKEQQNGDVIQKPVQVRPTTNQQTGHQSRTYQSSGYTRTHLTTNEQTQQKVEDLNQQNKDDFDDLTQKTQDADLILQTENNYADDGDYTDLTQQSQHGFDDLTQQTQHGFDDTTQQVQKEYKFTPINTQQKPTKLEEPKINNQGSYTSRQTQRSYQTQSRIENIETSGQPHEIVTPEPAAGYWKITPQTQQSGDLSQKPQTGYRKLEFSRQQHEDEQDEDLVQEQEDVFGGQQQEDLTQQHQDGFSQFELSSQQTHNKFDNIRHVQREDDLTQQTQDGFRQIAAGNQYQQSQHGSRNVVKILPGNQDLTQQTQTDFGKLEFDNQKQNNYEDLSQKTDDLGTISNTGNKDQGSGYSSSSSYSRSSSYSTQHQQQPQVVYSPLRIGSKSGQLQVYQTMQIPAGASEEMKRKLEEQLKQQLEQKMRELQSQQQYSSSQISMSPVHIGTQSGTGQLQVYQTMQIPAGASEELKHKMEQQLRQQLELKMQELRLQQQQGRTEFHQSSSKPLYVQTYSTGEGADCDDQTGAAASYSSSYSSSSSSGSGGGKHYSMNLRPSSTISSSDSSFQMTRQMQHPSSGYSYFRMNH